MKRIKRQAEKSASLQRKDLVAIAGGAMPDLDASISGITGSRFPRPRNPGVVPDPTDIPIPEL